MSEVQVVMRTFRELLSETKDGDWGQSEPKDGFVPYRVIRGGDFEEARLGNLSRIPLCYLNNSTVSRRTLRDKDILLETAGGTKDKPTGRSLLITQRILDQLTLPTTCASFARFLRVNPEEAVPEYVFWFLQHMYQTGEMWQHQVQHTGVARFQFTKFADSVKVPLPAKEVQGAIAHILGTLDDKIELNRRTNETLEAMARAIFKSWFVDFDPVRAKASGEPPESIRRRLGLTSEVLALFPDGFDESEFGAIPLGWNMATLSDFCELNAKSWSVKTLPGQINYVDLANTKNGVIQDVQAFTSSDAPSRARRILRSGDTIIGTVRPGNKSFALVGPRDFQLTGSTGFAVLSPVEDYLTEIVYMAATAEENIERLARLADGGAYPAVSPEIVVATSCVQPTEDVAKAFHSVVAPLMKMYDANTTEIDTLAGLRDSLLPKLLSGDLTPAELSGECV